MTEADLEAGFEMLSFLLFCQWEGGLVSSGAWSADPAEQEVLTLYTQLLSGSGGTMLQSTLKLMERAANKAYYGKVTLFYGALVKTLGLKVGNVVLATTKQSRLNHTINSPILRPYQSTVNSCLDKKDFECKSQLEKVYGADIEELSSHPAHLITKDGSLMPSALIPYCGFGHDMLSLGKHVDNFTYPVCTAFRPTLMEGQLCYELDMARIRTSATPGRNSGLVLFLDLGMEKNILLPKEPTQKQKLTSDSSIKGIIANREIEVFKEPSGNGPAVYVHTIQPFTFYPRSYYYDYHYLMTSPKYMSGTDNFLDLTDDQKKCSVRTYEKCRQEQFLEELDKTCGCVPFGFKAVTNKKVW